MANKFEHLALWYLRLNGYLTTPNFVLHPDTPGFDRTEADLLAVRFPYSEEVAGAKNMRRDQLLVRKDDKTDFIIAEVKSGECALNGPWTNPKRQNIPYVLRWLGMVPEPDLGEVADTLYKDKCCEWDRWAIRLVCFGKTRSESLGATVLQLTHEDAVMFMVNRFKCHADVKRSHSQWDDFIKKFYEKAVVGNDSTYKIIDWLSS